MQKEAEMGAKSKFVRIGIIKNKPNAERPKKELCFLFL